MEAAANAKTLFVDVDGCIFKHQGVAGFYNSTSEDVLPGVHERFAEWLRKGYHIILTTGRPNGLRAMLETQLVMAEIPFHQLIMGLPRGVRVVINDTKPDSDEATAQAVVVKRNEGFSNVDV